MSCCIPDVVDMGILKVNAEYFHLLFCLTLLYYRNTYLVFASRCKMCSKNTILLQNITFFPETLWIK